MWRCALSERTDLRTRPGRVARRARWAVTFYFVLSGTALAAWTARIPSIKESLRIDDAQITLALFAVAGGSVLSMQIVGHLVDRFGSARVMAPAGVLIAITTVLPALATDLTTLVISLLLFGMSHGMVDVAMNTQAVRVQRDYGRPIMGAFHAMFSAGGLLGAGAGALAAHLEITPLANFVLVALVLGGLSFFAFPALLPQEPRTRAESAERTGRWSIPPAILFLGLLGFFCSVGEGSMADWSSLYLHDELRTSPTVAAIGYAVFSAAMGVFRFLGDRLVERFGPVSVVRVCGTIAGVGMGTALALHHPVAAVIGFGLFGIGLSCIVPQVFSAAGNRDPERSGRDLAQVSTLAYGGLLAGPVVIGLVASRFGLTLGLAVPALLALLVAASATALRPRPAGGERAAGARPDRPDLR